MSSFVYSTLVPSFYRLFLTRSFCSPHPIFSRIFSGIFANICFPHPPSWSRSLLAATPCPAHVLGVTGAYWRAWL
eukprot:13769004-Heterocapsa_arctica.AAC.1